MLQESKQLLDPNMLHPLDKLLAAHNTVKVLAYTMDCVLARSKTAEMLLVTRVGFEDVVAVIIQVKLDV